MSDPIIKVKNISKKYMIERVKPNETLAETLADFWNLPNRILGKGISKKRDFWALKNINFDVTKNEVVGIIGRNGSGKSTLLKILSRITYPETGEARIRGKVASLLEVGTGFNPELTGRENVFLNGSILGMTRKEIHQKFDEIVDFSGVGNFIDTPVKRYSSGMYVRLAFAVAAHLDPDILIIDEVLAVGDIGFQKKCLKKMDEVTKTADRTVLFVSHNLEMVRQICPRSILLNDGKIIYDGPTSVAIGKYHRLLKELNLAESKTNVARAGSGHVKITHFSMHGSSGRKKFEYRMGEDITFKVKYRVNKEMKRLVVYIGFRSFSNEKIVTSIHQEISPGTVDPKVEGTAEVLVKDIKLRPGTYPIKIYVGEYYGGSPNYEALEEFTAPLTVITYKDQDYKNKYDELKSVGYFSMDSELIKDERK